MTETSRAALARIYRPKRFAEMATQEHVSETLRTAVQRGRTAHAYLFSGPRGVGKTTAARVLAMALNCPRRGEDGEPCGECESCVRIWAGQTSLDVIEIDAASNRGVDDARDLRERAMYAPTEADRYKIYIIDEAHMLTREAWNALLKILEEPPPRVIFVFATTEPQKIQQAAPPILSRCQRFDFRRIAVPGIVDRLRSVLAAEGVDVDEDALLPIARRADGGMRDALSLLDQVLSFAGRRVTYDDVRRVLGLVGDELYLELFGIIADRGYGDVFRFVQRLVDDGYDLAEFYRGLADALRALLVAKFDGAAAVEAREDLRDAFAAAAARFDAPDLMRMLGMVAELDTDGRFRKASSPRTMLEALLLRFAHLDRTVDLERLLRAAGGDDDLEPVPRPARPAAGPLAESAADATPHGAPDGGPQGGAATGADADPPAGPPEPETGLPGSPAAEDARGDDRADDRARSVRAEGGAARDAGGAASSPARSLTRASVQTAVHAVAGAAALPAGLGMFLRAAEVVRLEGDEVLLAMPAGPGLERMRTDGGARAVEAALAEALGRAVAVRVTAQAGGSVEHETAARPAAPRRLTPEQVRADQLARLGREQPLLGMAIRAWDLELVD